MVQDHEKLTKKKLMGYGLDETEAKKIISLQTKKNNAENEIFKFTQYLGQLPVFVKTIASLVTTFSAVYLIMNGEFTIGMFMAFQGFLSGFFGPINQIIDLFND